MTKHLHRDMDNVHHEILSLSALVEEMIDKAARVLVHRDWGLAREVVAADEIVDQREVHIEEECLKMLALHQPVAVDLRRIATVMKVNNDLERIADLAVNIAERGQSLKQFPDFSVPAKLQRSIEMATAMVRQSLDAFVNMDLAAARQVGLRDDDVDQANREIIDELLQVMQQRADLIQPAVHCFSAARHVERIADHATNIAEDVIYLVEGEIVRHKHK